MKCKNCGGELLFQNGINVCQSCGATFSIETVYENIDVYLCYVETDESGRRTKDSIIAQEVYQKLEAAKIRVFYERISADGIAGETLEAVRCSTMQKAKAVLVLGTSVDRFDAIVEKYASLLDEKIVIPFCIDVNPGEIPKSISKIQAINYNTIGWEKDIISGLYNLLDKKEEVNTVSLFSNARKKKIIIISIVSAVLILGIVVALVLGLGNGNNNASTPSEGEQLSQNAIYDQAVALLDQGKTIESLKLFMQIPEHPDSANRIKLIYSKYEGNYQKDGVALHLVITDNVRADLEVDISSGSDVNKFSTVLTVAGDLIEGSYQDNLQQSGNITITLEDTGLRFVYGIEGTAKKTEIVFNLSDQTDQQIKQISAETILGWLEKQHTYSQMQALGYELQEVEIFDRAGANRMYQIKDTAIYITVFGFLVDEDSLVGDDDYVVAVQAPAEILMPSHIGESGTPLIAGDLLYWPNGKPGGDLYLNFSYSSSGETIAKSTPVGLTSKNVLTATMWNQLMRDIASITIEDEVKTKYSVDSTYVEVVAENDTHLLLSAKITDSRRAWYKLDKTSYTATFVKDGPYQEENYDISQSLFSEYIDFAKEFPDLFGVELGSEEWNELVEQAIYDKIEDLTFQRYPQDVEDGGISFRQVAENDTHILFCARTASLEESEIWVWYKANKTDASVTFLKEGIYVEYGSYTIPKYLWFKEYRDFAKEFPALYGDPDEVSLPYLSETPFTIVLDDDCSVYTEPSFDGEWVTDLPYGTYTIVEVQPDRTYKAWGKLESGEGWICLSYLEE